MDKRTYERLYYALCAFLTVVILLTALLGASGVFAFKGDLKGDMQGTAIAVADEVITDSDEINATASEDLGYYVIVSLKDFVVYFSRHNMGITESLKFSDAIGLKPNASSVAPVTVIFRFNNVKSNGKTLLVIGNVKALLPPRATELSTASVMFLEDAYINVRAEYYELLEANKDSLSNIKIMLYGNGIGQAMYDTGNIFTEKTDFSRTVTLSREAVKPGDDIDNGGTDVAPEIPDSVSFWDMILNAFKNHSTPADWAIIAATCIIGVIALGIVLRLLGLILGLFKS